MSSTTDKAKGYANKSAGKAREKIGAAIGSDKMQAKGTAQTLKGEAQVGVGKVKDTVKSGARAADKALNK